MEKVSEEGKRKTWKGRKEKRKKIKGKKVRKEKNT